MPSALCFIDMPFGRKPDLASGTEIDFDHVYDAAIKPAIEAVGLEALRGDEEQSGGIIHVAMFARLLLAEFVVADLTIANPNVFYELGIRHAAKPFTTVPIFATTQALPFDVGLIRAIPYHLEDGRLTDENARALRSSIEDRLNSAINGPASQDSPLFQLLPDFPGIDLPHEVTEAFQDRVQHEKEFTARLTRARSEGSNVERAEALNAIEQGLGDLKRVQRNILIDLLLSYRAVEAWSDMVALSDRMTESVQTLPIVRQQTAFALNRRNEAGDRDRAAKILEGLVAARGPDPETLGLLGRVHKDRFRDAKKAGSIVASAALDDAIRSYTEGFEADPRDYYSGVNAVMLLVEKGDDEAMTEVKRLLPIVTFAVARRGGAKSSDYWDLATALELACIGQDWSAAVRVLPRVINAADTAGQSWMPRTTRDNLLLLHSALTTRGESTEKLGEIMEELEKVANTLEGGT